MKKNCVWNNKIRELIVFMLLVVGFAVVPKGAAEEVNKYKLEWVREPAIDGDGNDPICRDYEEVLNIVGEAPDKLKCNWTLPPDEKRFQKLVWKPIDWKDHWDFIKDKYHRGLRKDLREKEWVKDESEIRASLEKGLSRLYIAETDLNYMGTKRHVYIVREERDNCVGYGNAAVMNPETKRLDNTFEAAFIRTYYNSYGNQIILYHGLPFIFTRDNIHLNIYSTSLGEWPYSKNICRFQYIKVFERR